MHALVSLKFVLGLTIVCCVSLRMVTTEQSEQQFVADPDFTFEDFDKLLEGTKTQILPRQNNYSPALIDSTAVEGSGESSGDYSDSEETDECEGSGYFPCDDDTACLDITHICDGVFHCLDHSDELGCGLGSLPSIPPPPSHGCKPGDWQCGDGMCIERKDVCDGYYKCADNSDEENCLHHECLAGYFKCADGICIPESLRCDNHVFCRDASDELNCPSVDTSCSSEEYRCSDGSCIDNIKQCDSTVDCADASDEWNCPPIEPACSAEQFQCGDGTCIPQELRCDNHQYCRDGTDELGCSSYSRPNCVAGEFQCGDGVCIPDYLRCDNHEYCRDGSDEWGCAYIEAPCSPNDFQCSDGLCIPGYLRCDNHQYCRDGSDEWGCSDTVCRNDEWKCQDGSCIPSNQRCDGYKSCGDFSDEANCESYRCPQDKDFKCNDGTCIPEYMRCDGTAFCRDGSDEWGCSHLPGPEPLRPPPMAPNPPSTLPVSLFTIPNFQIVEEGQQVVFRCRDEGTLRADVRWSREGHNRLPMTSTDLNGRLTIDNVQVTDAGVYFCEVQGVPAYIPDRRKAVQLQVDRYQYEYPGKPACRDGHVTCASGDCIPSHYVCNGTPECIDGSDEERCSQPYCEANEFRCDNRKCVLQSWICDKQDDCGDWSDEKGCEVLDPRTGCQLNEFSCSSGQMCIPKALMCDNTFDCFDGTDEYGCAAPMIVELPTCAAVVKPRDSFRLHCRAVGFPTPTIVWRHNWHNLPPHCTSKSVDGYGELACEYLEPSHQGAYSCEALNYLGSTLGVRDTTVMMEPVSKEDITRLEALCY